MKANGKPGIAELSIDTQLLRDKLLTLQVGDLISYDDLSAVISRDVRSVAAGNLQTARRILRKEHRIHFETVRREGVKRADDIGASKAGQRSINTIHREAKRGAEKLACVQDFDSLPADAKTKHLTTQAALGALFTVTKGTSMKKLESKAAASPQALPLATTLEAFIK